MNRDSSVGSVIQLQVDIWGIVVSIAGRDKRYVYSRKGPRKVEGSTQRPVRLVLRGFIYLGVETAGFEVDNSSHLYISCRCYEYVELYHHSPTRPHLLHRDNFKSAPK